MKSVERYCPRTNTWTPVADLNERRYLLGVGVLNGIMYAVGGVNDFDKNLKSVEAYNPSSNTWISVSDMHKCRNSASKQIFFSEKFLIFINFKFNKFISQVLLH